MPGLVFLIGEPNHHSPLPLQTCRFSWPSFVNLDRIRPVMAESGDWWNRMDEHDMTASPRPAIAYTFGFGLKRSERSKLISPPTGIDDKEFADQDKTDFRTTVSPTPIPSHRAEALGKERRGWGAGRGKKTWGAMVWFPAPRQRSQSCL